MGTLLAILIVLFTVFQTVASARMAWRAKLKLGAVGLGLLALASLVTPAWVLWRLR
jgi:hypothetical protein